MATHLRESRAIPATPEDAFDRLTTEPLPELIRRRYGAFPPIREVRGQPPTWDTPGQTRRLVLSGGGSLLETITSFDRPRSWGYELTEITGPMKPLVETIDGVWSCEPAGTGCRVTWEWTVHPRGPGVVAMPVLGRMWHGYARQVLEDFEALLVGA